MRESASRRERSVVLIVFGLIVACLGAGGLLETVGFSTEPLNVPPPEYITPGALLIFGAFLVFAGVHIRRGSHL